MDASFVTEFLAAQRHRHHILLAQLKREIQAAKKDGGREQVSSKGPASGQPTSDRARPIRSRLNYQDFSRPDRTN